MLVQLESDFKQILAVPIVYSVFSGYGDLCNQLILELIVVATLHRLFKDIGVEYCGYNEEPQSAPENDEPDTPPESEFSRDWQKKRFKPFEDRNKSKEPRTIQSSFKGSFFKYFLDGTRDIHYLADITIGNRRNAPVAAAQIRAGCVKRDNDEFFIPKVDVTPTLIN